MFSVFPLPRPPALDFFFNFSDFIPASLLLIVAKPTENTILQRVPLSQFSSSFTGSRAGLNIALTWATLLHFGKQEYARRAQLIVSKAAQLADDVQKIPGLRVVGKPDVSVVSFTGGNGWLRRLSSWFHHNLVLVRIP